ncbi:MAG: glycosyltransferase family 4 protein [Anaerolinea sp.]|nr:glycosyltransferase family 4 protein [Anaerolinea sp.]
MKILHILGDRRLPRAPDAAASSGIVNAVLETARAQTKLGHQVWVASVVGENWTSDWQGVRLIGLTPARWAKIQAFGRRIDWSIHAPYVGLTQRHSFDLVIGNGHSYMRFLRAPVRAVTFHSSPTYKGSGVGEDLALRAADYRRIASDTDVLFAVSGFIAEELRAGLGGKGHLSVAYNGVDLERFGAPWAESRRSAYRKTWGVDDNTVVFLYAGAVIQEKGVIHLARAFTALADRNSACHLVIAGGALWNNAQVEYEAAVSQALQADHLSGRVHLVGKIERTAMAQLYAACDVVVAPSTCQEAFSLVALEALAAGKPVIASHVGGIPEIITAEVGLLVPPGDEGALQAAMLTLAHSEDLRKQMGLAARQRAGSFSWRTTAQTIDAACHEALQRKKGI